FREGSQYLWVVWDFSSLNVGDVRPMDVSEPSYIVLSNAPLGPNLPHCHCNCVHDLHPLAIAFSRQGAFVCAVFGVDSKPSSPRRRLTSCLVTKIRPPIFTARMWPRSIL